MKKRSLKKTSLTPTLSPKRTRGLLQQIVDIGKQFYERRWMYGTAGNLSARLSENPFTFAVTPSGLNKGTLTTPDFITVWPGAPAKPHPLGRVPSAETAIHQAIYEALPEAQAVFHSHPVHATILSELYGAPGERRMFTPDWFEMWKALGVQEGETPEVPIFANWQDITRVAADVKDFLMHKEGKIVPAIMIYGHGLTCWGRSANEARNHVEAMEYISEYLFLKLSFGKRVPQKFSSSTGSPPV